MCVCVKSFDQLTIAKCNFAHCQAAHMLHADIPRKIVEQPIRTANIHFLHTVNWCSSLCLTIGILWNFNIKNGWIFFSAFLQWWRTSAYTNCIIVVAYHISSIFKFSNIFCGCAPVCMNCSGQTKIILKNDRIILPFFFFNAQLFHTISVVVLFLYPSCTHFFREPKRNTQSIQCWHPLNGNKTMNFMF